MKYFIFTSIFLTVIILILIFILYYIGNKEDITITDDDNIVFSNDNIVSSNESIVSSNEKNEKSNQSTIEMSESTKKLLKASQPDHLKYVENFFKTSPEIKIEEQPADSFLNFYSFERQNLINHLQDNLNFSLFDISNEFKIEELNISKYSNVNDVIDNLIIEYDTIHIITKYDLLNIYSYIYLHLFYGSIGKYKKDIYISYFENEKLQPIFKKFLSGITIYFFSGDIYVDDSTKINFKDRRIDDFSNYLLERTDNIDEFIIKNIKSDRNILILNPIEDNTDSVDLESIKAKINILQI